MILPPTTGQEGHVKHFCRPGQLLLLTVTLLSAVITTVAVLSVLGLSVALCPSLTSFYLHVPILLSYANN